jgi:hypothetical protein
LFFKSFTLGLAHPAAEFRTAGLLVEVHQPYHYAANDSFETLNNGLKRAIASVSTCLSFELSNTL